MPKQKHTNTNYLKVSFALEEGSPEWYAYKAIKTLGVSQSQVVRQCLGAIYGAKGAMLEGDMAKAQELHDQGLRLLSVLGVPVNWDGLRSINPEELQNKTPINFEQTVQTSPLFPITEVDGGPVEDVEIDFEE